MQINDNSKNSNSSNNLLDSEGNKRFEIMTVQVVSMAVVVNDF